GIECRVLYRDALMIVIDKPAGMAVHRGPKGGASLEDFFEHLRFGLPRPPALAHRLDRETSGCLVLGRHRNARRHTRALFQHGRVVKTYWAVGEGGPEADEGEIELSLGRLDATRGWWMKPDAKGLPALTRWKVLGRANPSPASKSDVSDLDQSSMAELGNTRVRRGGAPRTGGGGGGRSGPPPGLRRHPPLAGEGSAPRLACARARDRAHAPAARALRRNGLADRGRCDLRQRAAPRRPRPAASCRQSVGPALPEARPDPG